MRLLLDIRFGTERYPEKVARRLRTVNIGTRLATAFHAFFAVLSFAYFTQFWLFALAHMVAMLLFAGVPLLHRLGPQVGPVATLVLFYLEAIAYTCLAGTGAGVQFYFLLGVALTMLYVGPEHIVVTTASAAVAAALIIVMQLTVPDDTGLLPWSLMVTALVTNAVVSCGTLLLIASYVLGEIARAETAAEREYERSERLLTNILPLPIAARLKNEGNVVIADRHDEASILFTDLEGFTAQASDMTPEDLVQFLNRVFSDFDRLVERHGLEKIKTTGDAYMVVSGVPTARPDHAQALAVLALEMREAATGWRDPRGRNVPIRIGISSGPVVAGVVGTRKFFYDVWGDAVNVAARMETTGVAGKIQISQDTYERLRDEFVLESRGEIEVKGKGMMPTWFLLTRKSLAVVQPLPTQAGLNLPTNSSRTAV
ncbi:adenylate/guanylate cyclase domain-containing protein [Bradyrhizobium sp.]|jgi:adenylate cyclase|uniref:adenylate/guanylate cyclase domain-containing protein n=1 Tax=Bradyrhizobium sp. TaxID=376 RepID=UPI003BB02A77